MRPKAKILGVLAAIIALTLPSFAVARNISNTTFPFSFVVDNPCNGDTVPLSGTLHVVQPDVRQ
jgi:type 1 fimbria pilin